MFNSINMKAFTLIELLVVVAIIGILAAVGVTTFGGFQEKAKISAAKANQKSITKYLAAEAMRCQLDSSDTILDGNYSCATLYSIILSGGNPGGALSNAIVAGLKGKFKNPYGANYAPLGEDAATTSGWSNDRDLGYTRIDPRGLSDGPLINISTCFKLPCNGDVWNNTNDNKITGQVQFN